MNYDQLITTANAMVQKGKGILAADESTPTCSKRFDDIGVDPTKINRNIYCIQRQIKYLLIKKI